MDDELDNRIYVRDEHGNQLEGEIVFEFEENGDDFVAYVIAETLYVMKYDEDGNLHPVDDDEWPLIEKIVEAYLNETEVNSEDDN